VWWLEVGVGWKFRRRRKGVFICLCVGPLRPLNHVVIKRGYGF
jgi:hypothetical protein